MLEMYAKRKRITLQHMNVSHKALLSAGTKARLEEAEDFAISKKHNIYLQKHRIVPDTIPEELLQEEWFFDISQNWHRNKGCCSSVIYTCIYIYIYIYIYSLFVVVYIISFVLSIYL